MEIVHCLPYFKHELICLRYTSQCPISNPCILKIIHLLLFSCNVFIKTLEYLSLYLLFVAFELYLFLFFKQENKLLTCLLTLSHNINGCRENASL